MPCSSQVLSELLAVFSCWSHSPMHILRLADESPDTGGLRDRAPALHRPAQLKTNTGCYLDQLHKCQRVCNILEDGSESQKSGKKKKTLKKSPFPSSNARFAVFTDSCCNSPKLPGNV